MAPGFVLPWPVAASMACAGSVGFPGAASVDRGLDVLHVTDYHVPRLRRAPVVATLYDAIPLRRPDFASQGLRSIKNALLRKAAAWADRVLAISEAAVPELVEHFGIDASRIRVVPLGIENEWLVRPDQEAVAAALNRHGLRPGFLLFVGTLQPRKNLARLIEAHRTLPRALRREHPLVVVGKYGWNAEEAVTALEQEQAEGTCRWLGYVTRADMRCLFEAALGFVFPSLAEGFGLPLLESMAAGTPAVASDLPVMRELGGTDVTYFDPASVEGLAEALRVLIDNRSAARLSASRALGRASSMTWERCLSETVKVYREAAASVKAGR